MNTNTLKYMVTAAEEKSLLKASHKLGISQPVLTKHLQNVEDELGCQLFNRGRTLVPTFNGMIFLCYAKKIIEREEQLQNELKTIRNNNEDHTT